MKWLFCAVLLCVSCQEPVGPETPLKTVTAADFLFGDGSACDSVEGCRSGECVRGMCAGIAGTDLEFAQIGGVGALCAWTKDNSERRKALGQEVTSFVLNPKKDAVTRARVLRAVRCLPNPEQTTILEKLLDSASPVLRFRAGIMLAQSQHEAGCQEVMRWAGSPSEQVQSEALRALRECSPGLSREQWEVVACGEASPIVRRVAVEALGGDWGGCGGPAEAL